MRAAGSFSRNRQACGSTRGLEWEGAVLAAFHQVNSLPAVVENPLRVNPAWERAHDNFHTTLLAGCLSKWLKHFATTLRAQTARYRHMSPSIEHPGKRNVGKEHEDIVKAVLARNADRACALLREHCAVTAQPVLERMRGANGQNRIALKRAI